MPRVGPRTWAQAWASAPAILSQRPGAPCPCRRCSSRWLPGSRGTASNGCPKEPCSRPQGRGQNPPQLLPQQLRSKIRNTADQGVGATTGRAAPAASSVAWTGGQPPLHRAVGPSDALPFMGPLACPLSCLPGPFTQGVHECTWCSLHLADTSARRPGVWTEAQEPAGAGPGLQQDPVVPGPSRAPPCPRPAVHCGVSQD